MAKAVKGRSGGFRGVVPRGNIAGTSESGPRQGAAEQH
jgi:hypothetical protein